MRGTVIVSSEKEVPSHEAAKSYASRGRDNIVRRVFGILLALLAVALTIGWGIILFETVYYDPAFLIGAAAV